MPAECPVAEAQCPLETQAVRICAQVIRAQLPVLPGRPGPLHLEVATMSHVL